MGGFPLPIRFRMCHSWAPQRKRNGLAPRHGAASGCCNGYTKRDAPGAPHGQDSHSETEWTDRLYASIDNVPTFSVTLGHVNNPQLTCPNSQSLTVTVYNAQIRYQMQVSRQEPMVSVGVWLPPLGATLPPGVWNFDEHDFGGDGYKCHAIRFAAVDPLKPAVPNVSASSA